MRIANSGACAARANVLMTWPADLGFGSVRWNARPSSPSLCAMWSMARATKSTGTMLILPPSTPTTGIQGGSARRSRWMTLKK